MKPAKDSGTRKAPTLSSLSRTEAQQVVADVVWFPTRKLSRVLAMQEVGAVTVIIRNQIVSSRLPVIIIATIPPRQKKSIIGTISLSLSFALALSLSHSHSSFSLVSLART